MKNQNTQCCFRCGDEKDITEFKSAKYQNTILADFCNYCKSRMSTKVHAYDKRAVEYGAKTDLTVLQWVRKLKDSKGYCFYCKKNVGFNNLVVEHMEPIEKGGDHSEANIVPACVQCNCEKGCRSIAEWQEAILTKELTEKLKSEYGLSTVQIRNRGVKLLAIQIGLIEDDAEVEL